MSTFLLRNRVRCNVQAGGACLVAGEQEGGYRYAPEMCSQGTVMTPAGNYPNARSRVNGQLPGPFAKH